MSSQAYSDFETRLKEVNQLLDAHSALTKYKRAQSAWERAGGDLARVGEVISHLVSEDQRGRRYEVHALNNAAIGLLSGHVQGFIKDLYVESVSHLLGGRVVDVEVVIKAAPTRGNPNLKSINTLFETIGFADVVGGISWQKMSNDSVKRNLREFNELRNRIVHGAGEAVSKAVVRGYKNFFWLFAERMDRRLHELLEAIAGVEPWVY